MHIFFGNRSEPVILVTLRASLYKGYAQILYSEHVDAFC